RIEQEQATNADARDLMMRARSLLIQGASTPKNSREPTSRAAFDLAEQALALDPGSIDARILIASMLTGDLLARFSSSVQEDEARAERLIREVMERDPNRSSAHDIKGRLRRFQGKLEEARAELETALALNRNNASAIRQLGQIVLLQGAPEEAIPYLERAIRLD